MKNINKFISPKLFNPTTLFCVLWLAFLFDFNLFSIPTNNHVIPTNKPTIVKAERHKPRTVNIHHPTQSQMINIEDNQTKSHLVKNNMHHANVSDDWLATVENDIRQAEYSITWQKANYLADITSAYHAVNRVHNFRAYFTPDGVRMMRRINSESEGAWGLTLKQYGYADHYRPIDSGNLTVHDNRIVYHRDNIIEWYTNETQGLRQGFTIIEPPLESERLELDLMPSGDLSMALIDDNTAVSFNSSDGVAVARYDNFEATDVTGKPLPTKLAFVSSAKVKSGFDASGEQQNLRITIDTSTAIYPISLAPIVTKPKWTFESDQAYANFGAVVATAGDVNGDGYDDIIVTAPYFDGGQVDEGWIFLYQGTIVGPDTTSFWWLEGNKEYAYFGASAGTAGDVNGDGFSDIIVGAYSYESGEAKEGRVFVYYGSAINLNLNPGWTAEGNQDYAYFGYSVGTAGDVNGDGFDDVVVGAPRFDAGETEEGRAFVFLGSVVGLRRVPSWITEGNQAYAEFGTSISAAGDVNGDGFDDVIVGAPNYSLNHANEGQVYLYYGSASGLNQTPTWTAMNNHAYSHFGMVVGNTGDVNGDGFDDVFVGAPKQSIEEASFGQVYVYYGSEIGLKITEDWTVQSTQADDQFGEVVSHAGDVNGDGFDDMLIGAYRYDDNQVDKGRVYLYYGTNAGLSQSPSWYVDGNQEVSYFGKSVGTAGDINGDGFDDIIIGVPWYSFDQTTIDEETEEIFTEVIRKAGRAYLYYGGNGKVNNTDLESVTVPEVIATSTHESGTVLADNTEESISNPSPEHIAPPITTEPNQSEEAVQASSVRPPAKTKPTPVPSLFNLPITGTTLSQSAPILPIILGEIMIIVLGIGAIREIIKRYW